MKNVQSYDNADCGSVFGSGWKLIFNNGTNGLGANNTKNLGSDIE